MTGFLDSQAAKYFSKTRLYRYAIINEGSHVQAYFDNLIISTKLVGMISVFEVIFRNKIHALLSEKFGHDYLVTAKHDAFNKNERSSVKGALKQAVKSDVKIKESRVLSELTLGFWCGLALNRKLWAKCLHQVHATSSVAARVKFKDFSRRIRLILEIRNKAAHHDRIAKKRPYNIDTILSAITEEVLLMIDDADFDFKQYIEQYMAATAAEVKGIVSNIKNSRGQ